MCAAAGGHKQCVQLLVLLACEADVCWCNITSFVVVTSRGGIDCCLRDNRFIY
jgi:hypothetical protein